MEALECQPEETVIIVEAIMTHGGLRAGRDMMKSVFGGDASGSDVQKHISANNKKKTSLDQGSYKVHPGQCSATTEP